MGSNIERLGQLLGDRMKKTAGAAVPTTLELGRINSDMSLTVDSIPRKIPRGDYMVSLHLTTDESTNSATHTHSGGKHAQMTGDGEHTHSGGEHSHGIPNKLRTLKSGDRVLVAWIGFEPIVVDIVVAY